MELLPQEREKTPVRLRNQGQKADDDSAHLDKIETQSGLEIGRNCCWAPQPLKEGR